jgi:hypothetical protein
MPKKPEPKSTPKKPAAKPKSPEATLSKPSKKPQFPDILPAQSAGKQSGTNARRPTPNEPLSDELMEAIAEAFVRIRGFLEDASVNIRALDRARLNGVGIKKQGFIERAYTAAYENEQFLPQYLTTAKFGGDFHYFTNLNILYEMVSQLREFIWNLTLQGADVSYTDALEFYAAIREAAKRRIDGAETVYKYLEPFFKGKGGSASGNCPGMETKKQLKRDFMALLRGKRDGKIVVENIKPQAAAGVRKVVDEKFTGSARVSKTEEGEEKE